MTLPRYGGVARPLLRARAKFSREAHNGDHDLADHARLAHPLGSQPCWARGIDAYRAYGINCELIADALAYEHLPQAGMGDRVLVRTSTDLVARSVRPTAHEGIARAGGRDVGSPRSREHIAMRGAAG